MRASRRRVFKICVNGQDEWIEDAGERTAVEVQHKLVTEMFKGSFVRVQEQYLGGAKTPLRPASGEEDEDATI